MKKTTLRQLMGVFIAVLLIFTSIQAIQSPIIENDDGSVAREDVATLGDAAIPEPVSSDSTLSVEQMLEAIFQEKSAQYSKKGAYYQAWRPSLRATYYALYILNAIGHLNAVDEEEVVNYVITQYDSQGFFKDDLALRYLDAFYSGENGYYYLSSFLQSTCYGYMILDLLGELDEIDVDAVEDFIWSCQHPTEGGFIGQPYSGALGGYFKTPTVDNCYHAVLVLNDILGGDFSAHVPKINQLGFFLDECQFRKKSMIQGVNNGSFYNELEEEWSTCLIDLWESDKNLLSTYQATQALSLTGNAGYIRTDYLTNYLSFLYDPGSDLIEMSFTHRQYSQDAANILGTALGHAIAHSLSLTPENWNPTEILAKILSVRTPRGLWPASTISPIEELVDTYVVISSLSQTGELGSLDAGTRLEIKNALLSNYTSLEGGSFCLEPIHYSSMELVHAVVSAHFHDGRSRDGINGLSLPIQEAYSLDKFDRFLFSTMDEEHQTWSLPLETECVGKKNLLNVPNCLNREHQNTHHALEALSYMGKLDDFFDSASPSTLMSNIEESQFLVEGYPNTGGYYAFENVKHGSVARQNYLTTIGNSYHAIRSMEITCQKEGLGSILSYIKDVDALEAYILSHFITSGAHCYFSPAHSNEGAELLEATYQAAYVLNAIGRYSLDTQAILSHVRDALSYQDIKELYFAFKISELLEDVADLTVIDLSRSQALLGQVYDENLKEFYRTTAREQICQEAFGWVSQMANNDVIRASTQYTSNAWLGDAITVDAFIGNLIGADDPGLDHAELLFNSSATGEIEMTEIDADHFQCVIDTAVSKQYHPLIAEINVHGDSGLESAFPMTISTVRELHHDKMEVKTAKGLYIQFNMTQTISGGNASLSSPELSCEIHEDGQLANQTPFKHHAFSSNDVFNLTICLNQSVATTELFFYYKDALEPELTLLGNSTYASARSGADDSSGDDDPDDSFSFFDNKTFGFTFLQDITSLLVASVSLGSGGTCVCAGMFFRNRASKKRGFEGRLKKRSSKLRSKDVKNEKRASSTLKAGKSRTPNTQ